MVPKERTSWIRWPFAPGTRTQAAMLFLWTSRPHPRSMMRSMALLLGRDTTGAGRSDPDHEFAHSPLGNNAGHQTSPRHVSFRLTVPLGCDVARPAAPTEDS